MLINEDLLDKTERRLHDRTSRRLKTLFSDNHAFQQDFKAVLDFYQMKLTKALKTKEKSPKFADQFFDYLADLFYQGYYLALEMFEHEDVQFADRFFKQPNGVIKEQVYNLLEGTTGGLTNIVSNVENEVFEREVSENNTEVQKLFLQFKKDIPSIAATYAIFEERSRRKLEVTAELDGAFKGILHRSDDLLFVDPEKFLICALTNENSEFWELNYWSTVPARNKKIGEVHLSIYDPTNTNEMINHLPYYQGFEALKKLDKSVAIAFICSENYVTEKERLPIVTEIIEAVHKRLKVPYDNINVTIAASSEYTTIKLDKDDSPKQLDFSQPMLIESTAVQIND